jgi:ferredoxin
MKKYKIEFDREACIGALACSAAAQDEWLPSKDGKVDLKDSVFNEKTKRWELIVEESKLERHKEAAELCPVKVIVVTELRASRQSFGEVHSLVFYLIIGN